MLFSKWIGTAKKCLELIGLYEKKAELWQSDHKYHNFFLSKTKIPTFLRSFLWRHSSISDNITIDAAHTEHFDNLGTMLETLSNVREQLLVDVLTSCIFANALERLQTFSNVCNNAQLV